MEIVRSKKKKRKTDPDPNGRKIEVDIKDVSLNGDILELLILKCNEIYSLLGSGHTESVYHRALESELRENNIKYESEVITPILYKGYYVGYGRADVVINRNSIEQDKRFVVELKALASNTFKSNEVARIKTYMRSLGINKGLLVNFPQLPSSGKCIFHYMD